MDRQMQQSGKGLVRRLAVLLGSAALVLPLAEPVGQRSGIVARTLLAMAATAVATPAQAQTAITLVSNSGKVDDDTSGANRAAQAFTTGTNASGYTLTSITLHGGAGDWEASSGNTATLHSGSRTGTQVATFTATVSGATLVLTPTSTITLTQESTYYLVTGNDFGTGGWWTTASNDEDSGAASGWSIADDSELYITTSMAWETATTSRKITVKGYANAPNNAPTVATQIEDQTTTVGTTFSFTFPANTFADTDTNDTLTYTAMLSDDSALPGWLSFDPDSRSFSGTPGASDGGTITVKVTATDSADAEVSDEFDIKVGTACPAPNFGERRDIWTGTVMVGERTLDGTVLTHGFDSVVGALNNTDFNIGANTIYSIQTITVGASGAPVPGRLYFRSSSSFTAVEVAALQLHVCDTAYNFSDATHFPVLDAYEWNDADLDWSSETTRTLHLSLPANNAATGMPTISGTAEFDEMLTAATSGIADTDGLPTSFSYQWLRENQDGMGQEPIAGATSNTYTLAIEDVGKKVRVRVSFTDQWNGMEEVTSAAYPATGTVSGPGVSLDATSVGADEGGTATYTLVLNTLPTGNVTVTPTSDDSGAVSVSPASLVFTTANWNTAQTVSVTAGEDPDATNEMVSITHAISGADADYNSVIADSVQVTVNDNDTRGITTSEPDLNVNEGGSTGTYTVELDTQPTGNVTIIPTSADSDAVSVSPASLVFTTANWNTAQTVSVTAREDLDATNEMVSISHAVSGADYSSVIADSVQVTVNDNDTTAPIETDTTAPIEADTTAPIETDTTAPIETDTTAPIEADTTAPRVASIGHQLPGASPTNADSLTWRITFLETVENVDTADFMVNGSTAMVTNVMPVAGEPLAYDVTISGGDLASFNGMVMLGFATGQNIEDTNGNALATTRPTGTNNNSYMVDNAAPLVTITDVPETSTAPFTATISFNEMVSGFTVADITVVNATLSAFTEATPGMIWTVLVTPEMDGPVTLDLAAGEAEDAAGNGNTATTQARSTYAASEMEAEARKQPKEVLNEVVLPDVIQQLTAETTAVITSRLNSIASGSPSTPLSLSLDEVVADTVAAFYGEREHLKNGSLEWRQALSGRDFVLPLSGLNLAQGKEGNPTQEENPFSTLSLWGGGNYSSYGNTIRDTDVDGSGFSAVIGVDLQPISRLTTGLALTTTRWGLDYATGATNSDSEEEGTYEIGITMVNPYMNWLATEQLSLWATVGYGRGEVEQTPDGEDPATSSDSDSLTSWAGGLRFEVVPGTDPLTGEGSPFGLAFKVDGVTSSFLDNDVQLARLAAEVSRSFTTVENGLLAAALELGWSIRSVSDKDDADGGGAELAGRLNWLNMDGSGSATVDARVLLGGGDRKEWGMGGHFRFTAPSRRNGEGLSLTLQPSFGITDTRLDELWSLSGNGDLAINNDQPGARLDAELAYGFPLGDAILTPYAELTWEDTTNTYGGGLRYGLNPSLELDLTGTRRSGTDGNPENRFSLSLRSDL